VPMKIGYETRGLPSDFVRGQLKKIVVETRGQVLNRALGGLCPCMGQAGREKALREFTLDRMFHETLRVYGEILDIQP